MRTRFLCLISLVLFAIFASACAARSAKPYIKGMRTAFRTDLSIDLAIFIRTMGNRPYSEDKAIVSLGRIRGKHDSFTQVSCQDAEKNFIVLVSPLLARIYGHSNAGDHYEYFDGYLVNLFYGEVDGRILTPPHNSQRVGLAIRKPKREQWILEKDIKVFGTRYITEISTGNMRADSSGVKMMECTTQTRSIAE